MNVNFTQTFQGAFQSLMRSADKLISSREFQEKAPYYATGVIAAAVAGIAIHELTRDRAQIHIPESTGTIIQLPQREMGALQTLRKEIDGFQQMSYSHLQNQSQEAQTAYEAMNNREAFVSRLPSFMANGVGKLVSANMDRVHTHNNAQANLSQIQQSTNTAGNDFSRVERQIEITQELPAIEGSLIDHRQTIETAQKALDERTGTLNDKWQGLNFREKMTYYIPS